MKIILRLVGFIFLCTVSAVLAQEPVFTFDPAPLERVNTKEDIRVEKLKDFEIKAIEAAGEKLDEAQREYNAAVWKIREAHGESLNDVNNRYTYLECGALVSTVKLRGHYALISTSKWIASCPVMATGGK